jgi:hypothetical protein
LAAFCHGTVRAVRWLAAALPPPAPGLAGLRSAIEFSVDLTDQKQLHF